MTDADNNFEVLDCTAAACVLRDVRRVWISGSPMHSHAPLSPEIVGSLHRLTDAQPKITWLIS